MIRDAGLTFPEGDPRALAACLGRLPGDPGLRKTLRGRSRSRVLSRFTHGSIARQTFEYYRTVLEH